MARTILFSIFLVASFAAVARAEKPKVTKASPDNGQTDVDPAVTELRVEFDQAMSRTGFSVVGGGENFPKPAGAGKWVSDTVFVFPMKLEPEHKYQLSINNGTFTNFKNKKGEAAEVYPISFTTRTAGAASRPAVKLDNDAAINTLRKAIDQDYSYRDRLNVDWAKRLDQFAPKMKAANTPRGFAEEAAKVLLAARDIHVLLKAGDDYIGTFRMTVPYNVNPDQLPKLVPQWSVEGSIPTGKYPDGIRYIMIPSWSNDRAEQLKKLFSNLKDAKALIIDVRPNGGGDELLARQVAGVFVEEPKTYSKNTNHRDGKDEGPFDRVLQPNKLWPAYRGRVAVLMGPRNVSSCESFLLMMKEAPNCTLIGEKSFGASGNPKPHDLGNGVTVFLPSWVDMLPDGTPLEGNGVAPDTTVKATAANLEKSDPVLDAALKMLREPPPAKVK